MRLALLFIITITIISCQQEPLPEPSTAQLIYSTSFEDLTSLEEDSWTGVYQLREDAPDNGGDYCLWLEPQWFPGEGFGSFEIPTTIVEDGIYQINFWSKTINWTGMMTVSTASGGNRVILQSNSLSDEDWTYYSLEIDATSHVGDGLVLRFSAGGTEVATGSVLIDELEIYEL